MHFTFLIISILAPLATHAYLNLSTTASLDRYVPGSVRTISHTLETDEDGALMVSPDGVMRSFSSNGTVIDFHQLDPTQLKEFAEIQLRQWQNMGKEIPAAVSNLAKAPYTDGRQVLDKEKLLNPPDSPYPLRHLVPRTSHSHAQVPLHLLDERQQCIGSPCLTFGQCARYRPTPCYQCYFPGGPESGACLLN
ncbi:hypothetical protein F5B22DRAFT_645702 [Xylaria bambusicola]|uniref:uncharacterized protein n=1 Tax=Xylaria bambusicola TaxID=326684 RepID=UPI002007F383|nr:uncharacterized protein F5B22DRAFT_645702 [Xylaria bambusicola]KAI0517518.1 hypothetical protein F5B22DRAFT_645702 [Xylaria bambusicola]